MGAKNQEKVKIEWSPDFAYAIGLITSDGCLHKNEIHISFASKDLELIEKFKTALCLQNKATKVTPQKNERRVYYILTFGDKVFYQFLKGIGLSGTKSKTIKSVAVPDKFFPDFLRGVFDGDGTFYSFRDRRWPNSFGFQMSFASASPKFINWLKLRLSEFYNVKGFICKGSGVLNLRYVKGDSRKLSNIMYYQKDLLWLNRKYLKVENILKKDSMRGVLSLQKPRDAAVAQW